MGRLSVAAAACALLLTGVAFAQHDHGAAKKGTKSTMNDQQKIKSALSAAPPEIARGAGVHDWPEEGQTKSRELKASTNGWVCFPSTPTIASPGEDPMCLDGEWQKWAAAFVSKSTPSISTLGIAYMLRGDRGVSNTDPAATAPTADNEWVQSGPHLMVVVPNPKDLDGYTTDPANGGPWVMFKGTPYAHLMVPVASPGAKLVGARGKGK